MYSPTCDEYNYVIIGDKRPYRRLADWRDGEASDLYLVNLETGERKLLFSDFVIVQFGVLMVNMHYFMMERKRYGIS